MEQERRAQRHRAAAIRSGDHGPYTALRWVSTLLKSAAVFLAVAVLAECIAGIRAEGWSALPILLGEVARATVLTILLWAGGDLVRLLLQIGKDLRAERVLLARIAHRTSPLEMAGDPSSPEALFVGADHSGEAESAVVGAVADDAMDGVVGDSAVGGGAAGSERIRPAWGRGDLASPGDGESSQPGGAAA